MSAPRAYSFTASLHGEDKISPVSCQRAPCISREKRAGKKSSTGSSSSHTFMCQHILMPWIFFFPFLILYWAAKVHEPLANLAAYECGLSFVVDPRKVKAKRSSDVDDVFTGGRRERQSRCCLAVYTKSGGQNWRTFTCGKRKTE